MIRNSYDNWSRIFPEIPVHSRESSLYSLGCLAGYYHSAKKLFYSRNQTKRTWGTSCSRLHICLNPTSFLNHRKKCKCTNTNASHQIHHYWPHSPALCTGMHRFIPISHHSCMWRWLQNCIMWVGTRYEYSKTDENTPNSFHPDWNQSNLNVLAIVLHHYAL